MSITPDELLAAVERLSTHLQNTHWTGRSLTGPDPGIRLNARVGRFIKSYLSCYPWRDDITYLQAQGYWIFNNWLLADILNRESYRDVAMACSDYIDAIQQPEGYWQYPNREWKGRIATVEGCFAALGLLDTYARTRVDRYLEAAKRWYGFLVTGMGFHRQDDHRMLAIKYFAHSPDGGGGVPNNSTLALWTLSRLYEVSRDPQYLEACGRMVAWLKHVQLTSGELPYAVSGAVGNDRIHFLCYQYNAFEFMDLAHYHRITGDEEVRSMMQRLARYLSGGLTQHGVGWYDCHHQTPEVMYYSLAIAQALSQAQEMGLIDGHRGVDGAYRRVLSCQRSDGSFAYYSRANYRCLTDRRSYPRYLSMIQHNLLKEFLRRSRHCPQSESAVKASSSRAGAQGVYTGKGPEWSHVVN